MFFKVRSIRELTVDLLNRILETLNRQDNITVGPGLSLIRNTGGMGIFLKPELLNAVGAKSTPGSTADPKILAFDPENQTLAEDTWNRDTDGNAVQYSFIVGMYYNSTDHKWYGKYRTALIDSKGAWYSITAESIEEIVQFVPHPA
ncbi:hypothetical protein M0R72_15650 [Candidatus Pacearchaeota archaeon]|jgi:hypothetical protein|nr:hypothetical protein [Candidatus Pacearchaeota archaeon]